MNSLTSMIAKLRPLGLYTMTGAISAELSAYALELDRLYDELDGILTDGFIATAGSNTVGEYERIFGPTRDSMSIERRRELLTKRISLSENSFTLDEIKRALESLNLSYTLSEYPALYRLNIIAVGEYSEAEQRYIENEVNKLCPAHIEAQVVFNTLTWSELDDRGLSFSQLDTLDMTWAQSDALNTRS